MFNNGHRHKCRVNAYPYHEEFGKHNPEERAVDAILDPQFVWNAIHHARWELDTIGESLVELGCPQVVVSALDYVSHQLKVAATVEAAKLETRKQKGNE